MLFEFVLESNAPSNLIRTPILKAIFGWKRCALYSRKYGICYVTIYLMTCGTDVAWIEAMVTSITYISYIFAIWQFIWWLAELIWPGTKQWLLASPVFLIYLQYDNLSDDLRIYLARNWATVTYITFISYILAIWQFIYWHAELIWPGTEQLLLTSPLFLIFAIWQFIWWHSELIWSGTEQYFLYWLYPRVTWYSDLFILWRGCIQSCAPEGARYPVCGQAAAGYYSDCPSHRHR